ncbi:MAG TPA: ABC transporter ATP-binding protein [Solirubrobacterales bacterium]|nr:ABC transporter ATP-binding protein [Solirubrobacterales bacterium]
MPTRSATRSLVAGHWRPVVGLSVTAFLSGIAEAGVLAVVAEVGTALVYGSDRVKLSLGSFTLRPSVTAMLILAAVLSLARVALLAINAHLQARLAADVQTTLRDRLFDAFSRASWSLQSSELEGHLQEMLTSQILQSTAGALQFAALLSAMITFLVLVISAMLLNVVVAVAVVIVAVALFGLLRPLGAYGRQSAKGLSASQLQFANGVVEASRMAEETHVFGVAGAQRERIGALTATAGRLFYQTQFVNRLVPALFQSLVYLTVVAGLAILYATGSGDVASLGAVILIMVRAGTYGQQAQSCYQSILQSLPFVERLETEIGRYEEEAVAAPVTPLRQIATIRFEEVGFSYRPGEPVLAGIGFEARRGDSIGIVGPSGSGKSTLIQILLRLRPPTVGSYLINGEPAADFSPLDWHRQVAYVPQKPQLLHATVTENIRYFRDIDDAMVRRAAELARIDADVRGWSDGYDTVIGPRADSISGGQQQRICLARALAAAPEMLVLDEPTSALDPRSESLIRESLGAIAAEMTLFVVTHRPSLLDICDSVLVLVDGRIQDSGRTEELRQANRYFSAA